MSNMLDVHAKALKKLIRHHGRPVLLTDPSTGQEYPLTALWNDVEHVLKMDNFSGEPMGERTSIYIDRDSMFYDEGPILPKNGWKATGSPNAYDDEQDYILEIPKFDRQLPGALYFLTGKTVDSSKQWGTIDS